MICLFANLIAGNSHEQFAAGTSVAAVIYVRAETLDAAERIVVQELPSRGWSEMETSRAKEITDYSQFDGREDAAGQAFRSAKSSGFGMVIYPEPGT